MTINDIPNSDTDAIKRRLMQQIQGMSNAELQVATKTHESLGYFIANAFASIAKLLGYVIAVPLAWGARIAESIVSGFQDGWEKAFRDAGF